MIPEKQFNEIFLKHLLAVLSNPTRLKEVVRNFNQNDDKERYSCKKSLKLIKWPNEEASQFTAAVAEALQLTMLANQAKNEAELKTIQAYSQNIQTQLIPSLVQPIKKNFIENTKGAIKDKLNELRNKEFSPTNNPYLFWGGGAVLAGICIGVTALTAYQSCKK